MEALQEREELGNQIKAYQSRQQPEDRIPVEYAVPDTVKQGGGNLADHKWGHNGENGTDGCEQ